MWQNLTCCAGPGSGLRGSCCNDAAGLPHGGAEAALPSVRCCPGSAREQQPQQTPRLGQVECVTIFLSHCKVVA